MHSSTATVWKRSNSAIDQFVNEASLPWWNQGVSEASLRTYSFLAQRNIPARLCAIQEHKCKENIHNMMQRIPDVLQRIPEEDWGKKKANDKVWDDNFDSIENRLSNYELVQEGAPFLELALWKANTRNKPMAISATSRMK